MTAPKPSRTKARTAKVETRKEWKMEAIAKFAEATTRSDARERFQYLIDWALCQPEVDGLVKSARVTDADVP